MSERFPGRRFHTALNGRVSWYCVPERSGAAGPAVPGLTAQHRDWCAWLTGGVCDCDQPVPTPIAAAGSAVDVDRLVEAFYRTPRKPNLDETEREHIERAVTEYVRLTGESE